MGFPSIWYEYVLLSLVNKEATVAYSKAEYSQAGRDVKSRQKETDTGRSFISKPQFHGYTQINRNRLI